jgi:hypothetical protein
MSQVASLPERILLCALCGGFAVLSSAVGFGSTASTPRVLAYLCASVFLVLAVAAFTHPRLVLAGAAFPVGASAIYGGAKDWHPGQIPVILVGLGGLVASTLILRLWRKKLQKDLLLQVVLGTVLVLALVACFGVVAYSSLGFILLGSLFVAHGIDGVISVVKRRTAPELTVTPNPSIERTRPGKPGRASHVKR